MSRTTVGGRAYATAEPGPETEAIEFVRFCHRRRRVGWPELYDEMCAVAGRGLYRGYGTEELAAIGIGFSLFQMPALAGIVARVVAEDQERRRRAAETVLASVIVAASDASDPAPEADPAMASADSTIVIAALPVASEAHSSLDARKDPEPADVGAPGHGLIRFAAAGA
jgi:hypothetical protein